MNLFGFQINRATPEPISFAPKENDDGAVVVAEGGAYGTYLDLDGSVRTEAELVTKYREMSQHPEVDTAIDDIVNEVITQEPETKLVDLVLDELDQPTKIKNILVEEFENILELMEFNEHSYDVFRRWYVDGRLYYHAILDQDPKKGIVELRYIDPRKIRKVREVKRKKANSNVPISQTASEYYIYNEKGFSKTTGTSALPSNNGGSIKIAKDSIVHCTSGLTSINGDLVQSYLHKAIKPLNQLRSMEDSLIIYRISRAPERRIFYIDVGNLPKAKAEQYLRDIMTKFKNKLVYDAASGEVKDDRKHMTMLEDFWLPRRSDSRGTEITTLPGGCLSMDTKVDLLDGRALSITDIETELSNNKTLWTYSCDPLTGKIVPGLISWAGVTQESAQVMKLTLDNGETITCTPDHKFPVWTKGFVEAKDLIIGESMIGTIEDTIVLISNIEILDEEITVGTLTIDKDEIHHDYHTFALSVGIFTKNSNLGEITDIQYFQKGLYRALNVPFSRLDPEQQFNIGRATEITRDEVKFSKFINRLRNKFATLFTKILERQLILKGIIAPEDWDTFKDKIQYKFSQDNYYAELKETEVLRDRIAMLRDIDDYAGLYYSHDWIRRHVLRQSDEDIKEINAQIVAEAKDPQYAMANGKETDAAPDQPPSAAPSTPSSPNTQQ
jgi:hypothetical protein